MTVVNDSTQEMVTEIYIESDLLKIKKKTIKIFALDSKTIGLSNNPPEKWVSECLWTNEAEVTREGNEFTIILPKPVVRFYQPKKIQLAGSIEQDNLLLIIHQ